VHCRVSLFKTDHPQTQRPAAWKGAGSLASVVHRAASALHFRRYRRLQSISGLGPPFRNRKFCVEIDRYVSIIPTSKSSLPETRWICRK
jgi:hypothetical protein